MNQKKCPKCGENNPPEAVMCWACYTPLSGGAAAPAMAGGAVGPRGPGRPPGAGAIAAPGDTPGGGASIQPWMYAVGGVVLLILIVVGAKVLMGGGSDPATGVDTGGYGNYGSPSSYGSPSGYGSPPSNTSRGAVAPPPPSGGPSGPSGPPVGIEAAPYVMGALPNPDSPVAVVGISPTQPMSPARAAGIAKFARTQLIGVEHWSQVQVYVFQDQQASTEFKDYQTARRNMALQAEDFASPQLTGVWSRTMAVYVFSKGGRETVVRPSGSDNWYQNLVG